MFEHFIILPAGDTLEPDGYSLALSKVNVTLTVGCSPEYAARKIGIVRRYLNRVHNKGEDPRRVLHEPVEEGAKRFAAFMGSLGYAAVPSKKANRRDEVEILVPEGKSTAYLRRLLAATGDKAERGRIQAYLDRIAAGTPMAPITEYRQTVGLTGSTPVEPFVVRCWRHGLLALPATLPAIVRRRRLAVLRELKLPGFVKSEQALFHGTTDEMDIWRMSLRRHRTIAFLAPFEHGLRYAHYALSTVFENLARTNAVLQQVDDQSGYEVRRLNKQPVVGFLAHDKVSPQGDLPDTMSWFPVGSKHLEEQKELVAMTCTRCGHANGVLPEIRHVETLIWKRPEAAAWIFQFNGKPIHPGTIGRLLRFLLPGHGRITLHDVRHLMANAAHAAGVPGWIISLALNHGKSDLWLYYAQLSNQQESLLEAASVRATVARSADARSKLALAA